MSKRDTYQQTLHSMPENEWPAYLMAESGLPGPRGNIELAQAAADVGSEEFFNTCLTYDAVRWPTNTRQEFLAFCGAVGLGQLLVEGKNKYMQKLRQCANDPRWRMREGVAMALQRYGLEQMDKLLAEMEVWAQGTFLEQRAAAAVLCEPVLLKDKAVVQRVLHILSQITAFIPDTDKNERKSEEFKALRKGLAYCWSVAAAADIESGKPAMEKWFGSDDKDIRWIMKQNLMKNRLARKDAQWVEEWKARLDHQPG